MFDGDEVPICGVDDIIALGDGLEKMNRLKEALVPKFEINRFLR